MFENVHRLESPTGATLAYRHLPAAEPARGILIVCHGLAEHGRRYHAFAREMAGHGLHVYAHDHRGHGKTTAPDAPLGRFAQRDGVTKTIDDVKAMRDFAVAAHPRLPVILFGHSMGGLIALNAAVTHPRSFDAVAIWNSNFHPGAAGRLAQCILRAERMLKGSDVPSGILPKLTFGAWGKSVRGRRTEFDWLSRDPAQVDAYIADPLCGFDASVSLWLDIFELTFRGPSPPSLAALPKSLPFHLVGGSKDPATNGGREILWLSERLKKAGFSNVQTKVYDGFRHETLNETGREIAIADFAAWVDGVLGS